MYHEPVPVAVCCCCRHCRKISKASPLPYTHSLQSSNTHTHCNTLQDTTTHCNTLHHTATHCNTLQHTATHCNTHSLHSSFYKYMHISYSPIHTVLLMLLIHIYITYLYQLQRVVVAGVAAKYRRRPTLLYSLQSSSYKNIHIYHIPVPVAACCCCGR